MAETLTLKIAGERLALREVQLQKLGIGKQGPAGPDLVADRAAIQDLHDETLAARDTVVPLASQVATDAAQVAADRVQTGLDRTQTGADSAQTGLDRVATGQDRTATGNDRTQTGLDRTATGQDRTQTGADRTQTGLDAQATAADRVQTGLDRAQTTADRTQTGLDRAQTGSDKVAADGSAQAANASQLTAVAQAALAAGYASSAASVAQQDLSGVTAAALYRSPNAITAAIVYDTSKDSDGGAWRDRVDSVSWMQEALNGNWLTNPDPAGWQSELHARCKGATLGAELWNKTWSTLGGNTTYAAGTDTLTVGSYPSSGQSIALNNTLLTASKLYWVTYTLAAISGSLSVVGNSFSGIIRTAPGTYTEAVPSTGGLFGFQSRGTGLTSATITGISVKEVTAFTTKSGDFYQLATDGKFYRLEKNQHGNSASPSTAGYVFGSSGAGDVLTPNYGAGVSGSNTTTRVQTGAAFRTLRLSGNDCGIDMPSVPYLVSFHYRGTLPTTVGARGGTTVAPTDQGIVSGTLKRAYVIVTAGVSSALLDFNYLANSDGEVGDIMVERLPFVGTQTPSAYELRTGSNASATITGTEVFRGNTAKFPRQSAIVAEAQNVTIYALDQPGRPMWMRFTAVGATQGTSGAIGSTGVSKGSLAALNAQVVLGDANSAGYGFSNINFVTDVVEANRPTSSSRVRFNGNIAQRQSGLGHTALPGSLIAANYVNAVAMTVRPNAPIDPVTGLQIPVIGVAVGTGNAGNIGSVILEDGTVWNYTQASNDGTNVAFTPRGDVVWGCSTSSSVAVMPLDSSAVRTSIFGGSAAGVRLYNSGSVPWGGAAQNKRALPAGALVAAFGRTNPDGRLVLLRENPSTVASGLAAQITGSYSTGYMVGDIRRAVMADTGARTVSNAELVTNGTFPTDASGWTASNATLSSVGGELQIAAPGAGTSSATQVVSGLTVGATYQLSAKLRSPSLITVSVSIVGINGTTLSTTSSTTTALSTTFVATATSHTVSASAVTGGAVNSYFDDISIKEVVADRSVKAKNASINGTLTRTAVATAAQLVAYSGFSNDPVVELVTNGDLASGTTAGWTPMGTASLSIVSGRLQVTGNGTGNKIGYQAVTTVPGRKYRIVWDAFSGTTSPFFAVGTAPGTGDLMAGNGSAGTGLTGFFTATTTTSYINCDVNGGTVGITAQYDNISVKAADAIGSAANVVQEAYSADLDPGTGAWAMSAWASVTNGAFGPANFVRNSTMQGAGVGVFPTNWTSGVSNGLAITISGTGVEDGYEYVDVRLSGTTTGAANWWLYVDGGGSVTGVAQGQQWIGGLRVKLQAGALPAGATTLKTALEERNSSNVYNQDVPSSGNAFTPDATTTGLQTVRTSSGTLGSASVSRINAVLSHSGAGIPSSTAVDFTLRIAAPQMNRGAALSPYVKTTGTAYNGIAPVIDRSGPSGAYYRMGVDGNGMLAAEAYDGTTTRRVTSTTAINDGVMRKLGVTYDTTGALTARINGDQVAQATGAALLTLTNANALLTIGNARTLDAMFPGPISLAKIGMTVPSTDADRWMFAQERAMFNAGAQITLADTGNVVDLGYDDALDRVLVATAANECAFNGLVRVASAPVAAGSIAKVSGRSGVKLLARTTTNPGLDVTLPSQNLKEELLRRAEDAARLAAQTPRTFDYDATASQTDFPLSVGWEAIEVIAARSSQREGSTKDWVRKYDGFRETVSFLSGQALNTWVQTVARRSA